jgi:hypothetical protein
MSRDALKWACLLTPSLLRLCPGYYTPPSHFGSPALSPDRLSRAVYYPSPQRTQHVAQPPLASYPLSSYPVSTSPE